MNAYFLDSSAVVKRYIAEVGSGWMQNVFASAATSPLFVARITSVEVAAAIVRRTRKGDISPAEATVAQTAFRQDLANGFNFVEVTPMLVESAMRIVERHGLRGYDAVQLAAALEVNHALVQSQMPLTFVAADKNLLTAANTEGLITENPNTH